MSEKLDELNRVVREFSLTSSEELVCPCSRVSCFKPFDMDSSRDDLKRVCVILISRLWKLWRIGNSIFIFLSFFLYFYINIVIIEIVEKYERKYYRARGDC